MTTYADKVNSLSPLAYYRLGEASGTTATDETGTYDGTYIGSPTLGVASLNVNDSDTAVGLDGVDDYVSVPTTVAAAGSDPRTIVLICDNLTLTGQKSLYCSGENGVSSTVFNISQIGAELYVYAGGGVEVKAPITLADFPMHIVASYDGTDIKMYINGALADSVSAVISTGVTTDHFFGRRSTFNGWSADYTEGTIDEAAIFNTALAETDILELYALSRIPTANYHTYDSAVNSLSPFAYYRLGEASGTTAVDSSGNGKNGAIDGSPTLGTIGLIPYDSDTAIDFDGVNDNIDTPVNSIGTGDYTLSCLLEMGTDPTSSSYSVIRQQGGTSVGILLQITTSNDLSFYQSWGGFHGVTTHNISSGEKYHVVAIKQGTDNYLYVNGVLVSSATDAISINPSGNFSIGSWSSDNSEHFDGTIDEVVIYNTALTADEVSLLYTSSKIDLTTLVPAPTTYADKINSLSPLAYYRLGEASGTTAADSSGNGNDGTYFGSPTLGAASLNVNDSDTAVDFDGVDDYVDTPINNIGTGDYTLSCLLEMPTNPTSSNYSVIRQHDGSNAAILIQITTSNILAFYQFDGADKGRTEYNISSGVKYHVVGVRQGTNSHLYINGVLVSSATDAISVSPLGTFSIGRHPGGNNEHFDGTIDEVAIFNTALAETDILELYALSRIPATNYHTYSGAISSLSPLAYYRLNETSGTTAADSSGNGNDGTYNGSPTLGATGLVPYDSDTAVDFDGVDDYVDTPINNIGTGDYTLSCLLEMDTDPTPDTYRLFRQYDGSNAITLQINPFNNLNFYQYDGANHGVTEYNISSGVKYHIVAVRQGTNNYMYVNGVLVSSVTGAVSIPPSGNFSIGRSPVSNSNHFDGTIDEAVIYNTALTADEVSLLYTSSKIDLTTLIAPTVIGIACNIIESLAVDTWNIYAYLLADGSLVASTTSPGGPFTLETPGVTEPLFVTVVPEQGTIWEAGTAYALDDLIFPSSPSTSPYYYKCTVAGTSDTAEPTWPTTGTVVDGTVTWEYVDTLTQPITHSPLIPSAI